MSTPDRERWDRKYAAGEGPAHFQPNRLLVEQRRLLSGGRALDLACGFGGNALYLAALGYRVEALDVSGVGLTKAQAEARRRGLTVHLVQADLARWRLPPDRYGLIAVFFYLDRALMPRLAASLRPGGLLFQANHNRRYLAVRPGFSPDYLLEPGELRHLALDAGLQVLHYDEESTGQGYNSRLIARR